MIGLKHARANAGRTQAPSVRVARRREVMKALIVLPSLVLAGPALARDAEAAKAACAATLSDLQGLEFTTAQAEERKRKLREAAQAAADTGTDRKVFGDSEYMVTEEARTPNVHSRQEEGPRSQVNV